MKIEDIQQRMQGKPWAEWDIPQFNVMGKLISPRQAIQEMQARTEVGLFLLADDPEEADWALVTARYEQMPDGLQVNVAGRTMGKADILAHLRARDDLGKQIVEIEAKYIKYLQTPR